MKRENKRGEMEAHYSAIEAYLTAPVLTPVERRFRRTMYLRVIPHLRRLRAVTGEPEEPEEPEEESDLPLSTMRLVPYAREQCVDQDEHQCAVCLCAFAEAEQVACMTCCHFKRLHVACARELLRVTHRAACPCCRAARLVLPG